MQDFIDTKEIPILWINLERATRRRARMTWALQNGGWEACRCKAVDANDISQRLLAVPNPFAVGTPLPGLYLREEAEANRRTNRAELACLASWKRLLIKAKGIGTSSGWVLLMEDDVGASLATPEDWAHSLIDLIEFCPQNTLAIQLAPISSIVREKLVKHWHQSQGRCLAISKECVRAHGNGAVLLQKQAIDLLLDPFINFTNRWAKNWHPLMHPWHIRPVADKWMYGSLPPGTCQVATYPHFCLEAEDSTLHNDHVESFHKPSRETTLNIWKHNGRLKLIESQQIWDSICQLV